MVKIRAFFQRKDIIFSGKRYGIDALSAMAQGLFCTLLVGTILDTLGKQLGIGFLQAILVTIGKGEGAVSYTIGGLASAMVGPGIAVAIGYALHAPNLVLFSLIPVGFAANAMGGAGGPLSVYFVAVVASEFGKLVSKETKIDLLVTPIVTILVGIGFAYLVAAPIGAGAYAVGQAVMWATELQPFLMGVLVSVIVGIALTLPGGEALPRIDLQGISGSWGSLSDSERETLAAGVIQSYYVDGPATEQVEVTGDSAVERGYLVTVPETEDAPAVTARVQFLQVGQTLWIVSLLETTEAAGNELLQSVYETAEAA